MKKNTKKGFTLVELLVVIAILAILATVSVVGYTAFIDRANQSNAQTEADQIKTIVENVLMTDDYVILVKKSGDSVKGIYATKNSTGTIEFYEGEPTLKAGETSFDATTDVTELTSTGATLTVSSKALSYTNYGYVVNVMTRSASKSAS